MSTQPESEQSLITPTEAANELLQLNESLETFEEGSPSSTNLRNFVEDCLLVDPKDRNSYIVGVCLSTPSTTFELDHLRETPWSKGRFLKPSRKSLVKEVERRGCSTKGIHNNTIAELLEYLKNNSTITDEDKEYSTQQLEIIKKNLSLPDSNAVRITLNDRLRFIHCLLSDEVKPIFELSQSSMSREELDARNSEVRNKTFEEAMVEKFNDESYLPYSTILSHMHSSFSTSNPLPLAEYKLTIEKCKDVMMGMKSKLNDIQRRYELSGNGFGQVGNDGNSIASPDCEIETLVDGTDLSKFLRNPREIFLIYWYYHLADQGLLKFTCGILPKSMVATTNETNDTSNSKKRKNEDNKIEENKHRKIIQTHLNKVSKEMEVCAFVTLTEKKNELQDRKMDLEFMAAGLNPERHREQLQLTTINRRLIELATSISKIDEKLQGYNEEG